MMKKISLRNKKVNRKYVHKKIVRHFFKFRYPKLELLVLLIIIAYIVFRYTALPDKISALGKYKYIGAFVAGILYSPGFSSPFAVGFFITTSGFNIFLAAILGGLGSLFTDMFIFTIIKLSFMDEFNRIKKTKPFFIVERLMEKDLNKIPKRILLYIITGFIIASPLPDEIGVTMLSGLTNIKPKEMVIISIILNTVGIFFLILLGGKFIWGL